MVDAEQLLVQPESGPMPGQGRSVSTLERMDGAERDECDHGALMFLAELGAIDVERFGYITLGLSVAAGQVLHGGEIRECPRDVDVTLAVCRAKNRQGL